MFKWSLRELFLLITLAGMGCGWWMDRCRLIDEARRDWNFWRDETFGYEVKALWLRDWIESRKLGEIDDGLNVARSDLSITDANGQTRIYRWDLPKISNEEEH